MDTARLGAEILLRKLGDDGRAVSLVQSMSALSFVLPLKGDSLDVKTLIETIAKTGEDAAFAATSWLGRGTNQSITPSHVLAAFGTRAVSLYAKELGVGVNLAIDSLTLMLPELIDECSVQGDGGPVLDLMVYKGA